MEKECFNKFEDREGEIKESQQIEQEKLTDFLKQFNCISIEIYNSEVSQKINEPTVAHYSEICGFPKYYLFLKECDYLGQFALSINADAIIFHDKSARGFGLLTHKILPILRLEKAIRDGKDPNGIKLPNIGFYNPTDDFNDEKYRETVRSYFSKMSGKRVIFFDESSGGGFPSTSSCVKPDGSEPYRWNPEMICEGCRCDYYRKGEINPSRLTYATRGIQKIVPEAKFIPYIGGVSTQGGFDLMRRTKPLSPAQDYNIEDAFAEDGREDPEKIFVKRSEMPKTPELTKHRQRLRQEHYKMAWELFQQVILKTNPYTAS